MGHPIQVFIMFFIGTVFGIQIGVCREREIRDSRLRNREALLGTRPYRHNNL